MRQVDQIKGKLPENLTHADVKLMIEHDQHEWLNQHQADLPAVVLREPGQLPRMSVEAWNDNPLVQRHLAILEWYAAAYTVNEELKIIEKADCVAALDACFGDEIYARNNDGVAVVALLFDIIKMVNQQCEGRRYVANPKMQYAPSWARHTMACSIFFKTGNVFLNDQLSDNEIELILQVISRFSQASYLFFQGEKGKRYLESLLETPISNEMSQRIARLGGVGVDADERASKDRPARIIGRAFSTELSWVTDKKAIDKNKALVEMLTAKLQSDQPYALFELMLPTLARLDLDNGSTFVEGGRLYGYFHEFLHGLMVAPLECAYEPYRRYLSHEFNARLENEKFGFQPYIVGMNEPAHNPGFFITCHAELKDENQESFSQQFLRSFYGLSGTAEYETYACASTLPGLLAAGRRRFHSVFNATEGISCMLKLIHEYKESSQATWKARIVASLKQMLINPDFPCDQTYALKIKGDDQSIGLAKTAKPILFSLVESDRGIAQALFDKIVLGGGCFLLNALMTNSDLDEVRYNTKTMKKFIPLMKTYTLSPKATSALIERRGELSLRDALMVLMFVTGGSEQSKEARQSAFNCLNSKIDKANLRVLEAALIFMSNDAKANLVGHLSRDGKFEKCHLQLLSGLGLKSNFITKAITTFINQPIVNRQAAVAAAVAEERQEKIYTL